MVCTTARAAPLLGTPSTTATVCDAAAAVRLLLLRRLLCSWEWQELEAAPAIIYETLAVRVNDSLFT